MAPECGEAEPPIGAIRNVDGIAIGSDGGLYYSTTNTRDGLIGRLSPTGTHELPFIAVPGEPTNFGLAYDSVTQRLYFAGATSNTIYVFELGSANPKTPLVFAQGSISRPNDLVLAPDGAVFISNQDDRGILRKTISGPIAVVASEIGVQAAGQSPAGLAFGPDGALYVGIHNGGRVQRVVLGADGRETSRADYNTAALWGNGLAFDELGRLYVATYASAGLGGLLRIDAGGAGTPAPVSQVPGGNYASIAFGRGALRCDDLYLARPSDTLLRVRLDAKGLALR